MELKMYPCKTEEVPSIAGFLINSMQLDLNEFSNYSPIFTDKFILSVESQKTICTELLKTTSVTGQMKLITQGLNDTSKVLRTKLNPLEGYLNLASDNLDMKVADFGLQLARKNINCQNIEGAIQDVSTIIGNVKRNQSALEAIGMKSSFVDELSALVVEMGKLNESQRGKWSERTRLTDANRKEFNKLWEMIRQISEAGRGIYKGTNNVKLLDYTLSNLRKRIRASNKKEPDAPDTTDVTAQ